MGAVAERVVVGLLALTERVVALLLDRELKWLEFGALVGSVAVRLVFARPSSSSTAGMASATLPLAPLLSVIVRKCSWQDCTEQQSRPATQGESRMAGRPARAGAGGATVDFRVKY